MGIAFIGTMCRRTSAYGVSQDGTRALANVATTVAHEMGHNFDMNHDDGGLVCVFVCLCVGGDHSLQINQLKHSPFWSEISILKLQIVTPFPYGYRVFESSTFIHLRLHV